jgi:selenide,water dikinase
VNHELSDVSTIETNSSSLIQSIDHIKLFSSLNPFDFGIISYLHSQNDILSGGGLVKSLSISVALPFSEDATERFYMEYFMRGIQSEANKDKSIVASGHSFQSSEAGITITMNGIVEEKLSKNYAQESDLIYLSKPLGTGYLLAAYFNNTDLLTSDDFQYLINCLKTGNKEIAQIAKKYHCNVMTDISGFGLASHLGDICKSSNLTAKISLNSEILINSNINILNKYQSTGFKNNYLSSSKEFQYQKNTY